MNVSVEQSGKTLWGAAVSTSSGKKRERVENKGVRDQGRDCRKEERESEQTREGKERDEKQFLVFKLPYFVLE